jgi:hypothetical protein
MGGSEQVTARADQSSRLALEWMVTVFTTSLCRARISAHPLDPCPARIIDMDAVAVLLAIVMFAALFALIYGIDRI